MRSVKTWTLMPLLASAVLLTRCSCDFFGTTGGLLIPEPKEVELGRSFDSTLVHGADGKKEFPLFDAKGDPARVAFENYVKNLAREVLAAVPERERPGYDFKFSIIDKDVENAFAVPGGFVYIYTGIIKKMRDESELAGVLGHEIAHVTKHHYRDAVAKQAGMGILLDALLGNNAGALAQAVAGTFFQLASLQVSQANEQESDERGTVYTARAGRNPLGIAKYFARAEASGVPEWLSSHPASTNRVKDVSDQVDASASYKALVVDSATTNYKARFDSATAVIR